MHVFILVAIVCGVCIPASAQIPVRKGVFKSVSIPQLSSTDVDTLSFSTNQEPFYFTTEFGRNVTIAYRMETLQSDTLQLVALHVPFYGGRTDVIGELYPARIRAVAWDTMASKSSFSSTRTRRVSSIVDVSASAEEIKWIRFAFSDTLFFKNQGLWIGIQYDNSTDTVFAVSPVFSAQPLPLPVSYQRTIRIDSATVDTVRYNHNEFWESANEVGGMNAYLEYRSKNNTVQPVKIEPILLQKPNHYSIKAYPNPFNPTTTLRIRPKFTGEARLQILDSSGRILVSKNVFTNKENEFEFLWDASMFASGVYFVKFIENNNISVSSVTLLK